VGRGGKYVDGRGGKVEQSEAFGKSPDKQLKTKT